MFKGGYKIIDLKNTNFTVGTASAIVGVYDAIARNYGKAIMLNGIVIGGVEFPNTFVELTSGSTCYNGKVYGYNITINDDNEVTFATDVLVVPALPSDASSKTYTLEAVNGVLTWVE